MLEKVKLALRISHNHLDTDITETISTARKEMVRVGIPADVAHSSSNDLVDMAIKTYCLYIYGNEKTAPGYFESWQLQLDQLRKSDID